MENSILFKIHKHFSSNPKKTRKDYYIPSLWTLQQTELSHPVRVNFNTYFSDVMKGILLQADSTTDYARSLSSIQNTHTGIGGDWSYTSSIYNLFPRLTTAYDHDQDGNIGIAGKDSTLDKTGTFKETGTFLKCIALLPYIKSLGVNVIHCLPITSIGQDGNKGDLGSPYAIKNPYLIDDTLAEPAIPFTLEEQFKAFIEAAHMLDIRIVLEFVLRTSSKDSDWIKTDPQWFYWIDQAQENNYCSPAFPENELQEIKQIPFGSGFHHAPDSTYRNLFKKPPLPSQIKFKNGRYIAQTSEGTLVIAGAFADWPPDDIQPAWSDVTYLRIYNHPFNTSHNDYNYIAYNTIRHYDPILAQGDLINHPLWDKLCGVIPHYQIKFGIDGVMLDMGHSLPKELLVEIIHKARNIDSDFAFFEENFKIEWSSRKTGFNATLGFEWRNTGQEEGGIKAVMQESTKNLGLPFFGTPETHNTPRAMQRGGKMHAQQMWAVNSFLPSCIPFIHSGYELYEDRPVNLGLNFTPEEISSYSKQPLGLFYKDSLNWNKEETLIPFIQKVATLRQQRFEMIANGNEHSICIHHPENPFGKVIAFERFDPKKPWDSLLIITNTNYKNREKFYLKLQGTFYNRYKEHLSERLYSFVDHWISADLEPGQVMIFEIDKYLG